MLSFKSLNVMCGTGGHLSLYFVIIFIFFLSVFTDIF